MEMRATLRSLAEQAKSASALAAQLTSSQKNRVLETVAQALREDRERILATNGQDLERAQGLSAAMRDRLTLSDARIEAMARGLEEIVALPDPVGEVVRGWVRPNGLRVEKVRIPLGVIAMIYEARPNVTIDAAGLCFKSGNVAILRGGSEATQSNQILAEIFRNVLQAQGISPNLVQILPFAEREAIPILLAFDDCIDIVIPRGGEGLMKMLRECSKVPIIKHDKGVCHIFVDYNADLNQAEAIVLNSKIQRPGVCNALETLLVDQRIADSFLPRLLPQLEAASVEVRGCPDTQAYGAKVLPATEADWDIEYLDKILSIKIVSGLDEALGHIRRHGSLHTEAILTNDAKNAERFLREALASVVLLNASTRFNDGGELGLGAEIGISTTKLHAFGPMGLEELTTQKYVVRGEGQIRE